jgi:catechol-2,3-dioxygenase
VTPVYHFAFNIPPDKFGQALAWMESKVELLDITPGIKIADFVNWNAKSIYFNDNNGNILEFIARYDLAGNGQASVFSAESIISISEIGIASDNVTLECDELMAAYDIPLFTRQPRQNNFTVLGDDHGLLIFSSKDRNWYPTQTRAQRYPVKLIIASNGKESVIEFQS